MVTKKISNGPKMVVARAKNVAPYNRVMAPINPPTVALIAEIIKARFPSPRLVNG